MAVRRPPNRCLRLWLVLLVVATLLTTWVVKEIAYNGSREISGPVNTIVQLTSKYASVLVPSRPVFNASDVYSRIDRVVNGCGDSEQLKPRGRGVVTEILPVISKDCQLLRAGDMNETTRVVADLQAWQNSETIEQWRLKLSNCSRVLEDFSNNFYVSQEELDFPIAFTFIVYTNAPQVMRLLKAIYRPHNVYCIHPDAKQPAEFIDTFKSISKCLGNIFLASKLEEVYYHDGSSIIRAQLNCMENLLQLSMERWRYVINVCGTELPLKTNRQIVQTLKKMNRVSGLSGTEKISETTRLHRFTYITVYDKYRDILIRSNELLGPPPHNITLYKSQSNIAASRDFANFTLNSQIAVDFREFLSKAKTAEEHFYASLYFYPGAPGGYNESVEIPIIERVMWMYGKELSLCHGDVIHGVCIVTVGDLPEVYRLGVGPASPVNFFFNKYSMERDHLVMDCLEEELLRRNFIEYNSDCQP